MQQLVYPTFIANDEYKLRSIIFTAMSHDIEKDDSEEAARAEDLEEASSIDSKLAAVESFAGDAAATVREVLSSPKFEIQGQIVLPLPDNIVDSQSHAWGEETGVLYAGLSPIMNASPSIPNNNGNPAKSAMNGFISQMNVGSSISRAAHTLGIQKPVLDPSFFQSYSGSALRSFMMIFNFIPESVEEAQTIQKIILTFKNWTSPSKTAGSIIMLSPLYLKIEFGNPYISQMFNMNCVVCREIQVDYGADGNMQQFQDGFPKQITLTMSFAEAKLSYADNYKSEFSRPSGTTGTKTTNTSSSSTAKETPKSTNTPKIDVKNETPASEPASSNSSSGEEENYLMDEDGNEYLESDYECVNTYRDGSSVWVNKKTGEEITVMF